MNFTPTRITQAGLSSLPVSDGQLIFAYDTGNIYLDTAIGRFQQGINILSDSSQLPLAVTDKLYFIKDSKQILYRGQPITGKAGMKPVIIDADIAASVNQWYLCQSDCTITLPQLHQQGDSVKVSTVLQTDNVVVQAYTGDTIQSDSSFKLDLTDASVQFIWHTDKWLASQIIVPRERMPFAIVDSLPTIGDERVYYNRQNNKYYYWDGAWRSIADYQDRVAALQQKTYKAEYDIKLGKCTGLGVVYGSDSVQLTWTDPADVQLETAVLAEWKQTVLMKKIGQYPSGPSDSQAQTVAVTSRALGNKNHYSNNPLHQSPSDSTYYKLFSQTVAGAWNSLDANCYPLSEAMSWGMIQSFVRAGRGPQLFPVGTVFQVEHPQYTHTNGSGLLFRVAGHDQVPATDEALTHTMCLELVDILFNAPYDASEPMYALTKDTTAQAGKIYYAYSNGAYTALADGTDYDIGDPVPLASWYEKNLNNRNQGSNNAEECNMLQWLNSSGAAGDWFEPQTLWDVCSTTLLEKNGFMRYLDPEFLAVVQNAKLRTRRATPEGGGYITQDVKFWFLSMSQVFANSSLQEDGLLSYYSNGGSPVKTLPVTGAAAAWCLRTPSTTTESQLIYVMANGSIGTVTAGSTYGCSFACIIA